MLSNFLFTGLFQALMWTKFNVLQNSVFHNNNPNPLQHNILSFLANVLYNTSLMQVVVVAIFLA